MRFAVTGITGGVGMRFAEIALEGGHEVTGLVRDPSRDDARRLAGLGARLVRGDLHDTASLDALCRGAEVVVHLAAHVGGAGTLDEFVRVNVGGTRNAVTAAAGAAARRFVQLSSVAVYGRPDHGCVTEEWPTRKIALPYEDTKTEAERSAFRLGVIRGIEVTAIRPPIIYGPYDRNFMPRVLAALRGRRFLLVDGGRAPLNVAWVDHVIDVLLLAAASPAAVGQAFNVMDEVDSPAPSVKEIAEIIAREAGLPPPRLSIPYRAAMALARAVKGSYELVGATGSPPLTPFDVKQLTRDVIYDSSKAVRVLDWRPQIRARDGIARAARAAAAAGRR